MRKLTEEEIEGWMTDDELQELVTRREEDLSRLKWLDGYHLGLIEDWITQAKAYLAEKYDKS